MTRYDPYTDTFIQEGWVCPRCGQVMAPWMPYCNCKLEVTYTKESSTTAPTGKSYTIKQSSDTVTYVNSDSDTSSISTPTIHDGSREAGKTILMGDSYKNDIIDGWTAEHFNKELLGYPHKNL